MARYYRVEIFIIYSILFYPNYIMVGETLVSPEGCGNTGRTMTVLVTAESVALLGAGLSAGDTHAARAEAEAEAETELSELGDSSSLRSRILCLARYLPHWIKP